MDPSGHYVETAYDVASFGSSCYDFYQSPDLINGSLVLYDGALVLVPILPGSAVGKAAIKGGKAVVKKAGKTAVKGVKNTGKKVQEGVNPNSLIPTKDLSTLDSKRMQKAIKNAGDKPIIVDGKGRVLDGHHCLKYAIMNNKAVDVCINGY